MSSEQANQLSIPPSVTPHRAATYRPPSATNYLAVMDLTRASSAFALCLASAGCVSVTPLALNNKPSVAPAFIFDRFIKVTLVRKPRSRICLCSLLWFKAKQQQQQHVCHAVFTVFQCSRGKLQMVCCVASDPTKRCG